MKRIIPFILGAILACTSAAHAQPISSLPSANTPLAGTEVIIVNQDGVTKRATAGDISSTDHTVGSHSDTTASGAELETLTDGSVADHLHLHPGSVHADGADCSAGSYPLGVDVDGAAEDCTDASTEIDTIVATHNNGSGISRHLAEVDTQTGNYTANANEFIPCNVAGGDIEVQLPTEPPNGTEMVIVNVTIAAGNTNVIEILTGGSDTIALPSGPTSLYINLLFESIHLQYDASADVWLIRSRSGDPAHLAQAFPGIDAQTPLPASAISVNTTTRVLTITPPLGYFYLSVDGNGRARKYRKNGNVDFPAFDDTDGIWHFYFNSTGTPVATQTPWTISDFETIAPIYRFFWNSALVGDEKIATAGYEVHPNDIPADTHEWMHLYGTVYAHGLDISTNAISAGSPNADGRNAVVALSSGAFVDDNITHTVTNGTGGGLYEQDLGDTTPATLNATNSGIMRVTFMDGGTVVNNVAGTRFPFTFSGSNIPEYITASGVRTEVTNNYRFVTFIWTVGDPRTGKTISVTSATEEFATLVGAQAYTWDTMVAAIPLLGDGEIRPLYRLIFERKNSYSVGSKYAVLREVQDLRKAAVTSTSVAVGSIPASSVTVVPAGDILSTNAQSALEELDGDIDTRIATHDSDADNHHAESHAIATHSDTTATGAETETLTDGSNADSLHIHTDNDTFHGDGSNCSAGNAPVGVDANGAAEGCFDVGTQAEVNAKEDQLTDSASLAATISDETGTGLAMFNDTPAILTPDVRGKVTSNTTAVDDDDCTGEEGSWWFDTTDTQFEFCEADTGIPSVLDIAHSIASHNDTTATGAELETLTDTSNADALHSHAGASGTMTTVKENDAQVGGADIVTIDFLGADFDVAETPDTEIQITIAGAIARDVELHNESHTVASHSDTTGTGAELEELTDGSTSTLHAHTIPAHTVASHSDTTATGAELETLTDDSNANALHFHGTATKTTAAGYTIGTTDPNEKYGGVIYVTSAATIVIPAVAVEMSFTVITIGATAVSVDPNASDKMYLDGVLLDDGDKATNTSTTGDALVCSYFSADGWYCMSGSPDGDPWTDGS